MADKKDGKLYIAFLRSGKIYIAVNTNRSLFKVDYNPKVDYDMMMKNFLDDMKWFTDMIDKLRAENTIYKKEMSI